MIIRLLGEYSTKEVYLNGEPLNPEKSQRVINHSPDGFNWGYAGSGCAQLALAILLELTADKEVALKKYQHFKSQIIANLPKSSFDVKIQIPAYYLEIMDEFKDPFLDQKKLPDGK